MKFRSGTLHTQKLANLFGGAISSSCLLCHQPDSQIHMLSGCQNASIQNMVTERHNITSRLIIKTLNKGDFGGSIIFTAIGSETWMAQQSLVLPAHEANRTLPNGFYQTFQHINFDPSLDQMLFAYCQLERRMAIKEKFRLHTLSTEANTSLKSNFCNDTQPEQQLPRAAEQSLS